MTTPVEQSKGHKRAIGGRVTPTTWLTGQPLARFLAITVAVTWVLWWPVALLGLSESAGTPFVLIGAFVPSAVGVVLMRRENDADGRSDFWRRVRDPRHIGPRTLLIIVLLFPAITGLALTIAAVSGMALPSNDNLIDTVTSPITLLSFVVVMAIGGPLAEELGWRGYALDHAQSRWTPRAASAVIGAAWALWHLPLFFIDFTTQGAMGPWSIHAANWAAQVVLLSFVYTWAFNSTRRSILSAIVLHFMWNSVDTIIVGVGDETLPLGVSLIKTTILALVVLAVVSRAPFGAGTRARTHYEEEISC